jgi:hypothetical protein
MIFNSKQFIYLYINRGSSTEFDGFVPQVYMGSVRADSLAFIQSCQKLPHVWTAIRWLP